MRAHGSAAGCRRPPDCLMCGQSGRASAGRTAVRPFGVLRACLRPDGSPFGSPRNGPTHRRRLTLPHAAPLACRRTGQRQGAAQTPKPPTCVFSPDPALMCDCVPSESLTVPAANAEIRRLPSGRKSGSSRTVRFAAGRVRCACRLGPRRHCRCDPHRQERGSVHASQRKQPRRAARPVGEPAPTGFR